MESSPIVLYITFPKFLPPLTSIDFLPPSSILLSSPPFHYIYNLLNSSVCLLPLSSSSVLNDSFSRHSSSSFCNADSTYFSSSTFSPFLSDISPSIISDLPPTGWNGRWERVGQGIITFENFLKERIITNVISYKEVQGEKITFFIEDVINWSDSYFIYKGDSCLLKKQKDENEYPYQIKESSNKDCNERNYLKNKTNEENLNEMLIYLKIFETQILLLKLFLNNGTHEIIRFPKKIIADFFPVYSELWEYKERTVLEIWGNSSQNAKLFLFEMEEKEEEGRKKGASNEEPDKTCEKLDLLLMTNVFHEKTSEGLLLKKSRSNIEKGKLKTILILKNEKCLKAIFYELFIQDLNKITTNISRSIVFEEIIDLRKEYLICFSNLNNFFVLHKSKKSSYSKGEEEENLTQIKLQIFRDIPEKHVFQAFLFEKTGLFEKFGEFICSEIIKF